VGNGLTMADAALSLCDDPAHIPQLVSLSRRGLLPLPQTIFASTAASEASTAALTHAVSARELLAAARALTRDLGGRGGDWREVVTAIRHLAPRLWENLPPPERRRFIRHLQSYWDVHRHRLPPTMWSRLESLRHSGRLEVNAGRIVAAQVQGNRLSMTWRPRGSDHLRTLLADAVVNALGPDYVVRRSRDKLLQSLLADGLILEDDLQLGIHTGANGTCVTARESAKGRLFYLGPLLRADYWEATAATELRDHAERMARHLIAKANQLPV
jgi:uncharacterized NAD(P)/FAD-binding protein YdhS